jgi:hypothetical protein
MSTAQNLIYAAVQVAHNLGAVAVMGGSLGGIILKAPGSRRNLAKLALAGWGTQALSGASFGAVSYHFYGKFPDIGEIASAALLLKMACAAIGFMLMSTYLVWGTNWSDGNNNSAWHASTALALTALSAAAFLRWFS